MQYIDAEKGKINKFEDNFYWKNEERLLKQSREEIEIKKYKKGMDEKMETESNKLFIAFVLL